MGSNHSKNKINYEDVQHACINAFNSNKNNNNNGKKYAIINTMDKTWQSCLIQSTIPIQEEEESPVYVSEIFKTMFSQPSTWVDSINEDTIRRQEGLNNYFISLV
jgi:hypothetical protein